MSEILATNAYRHQIALAAASGTAPPRPTHLAFGDGSAPPSPDDVGLQSDWLRIPIVAAVADGVELTVTATLDGALAGTNVLREVGVLADDGTLMGRRITGAKELEPGTTMEFSLTFQF